MAKTKPNQIEKKDILSKPIPSNIIAIINDFKDVDKNALKLFQEVKEDELTRKKKIDSYTIRKWITRGIVIFVGLVVFSFFGISLLAILGIVNNTELADLFLEIVIAVIGTSVGFCFGIAYEYSKK